MPNFAVVTGVNGSGKSHLLQAIEAGKVQVEGLSRPRIVHFNYETFRLDNEDEFTAQQLAQEKEREWVSRGARKMFDYAKMLPPAQRTTKSSEEEDFPDNIEHGEFISTYIPRAHKSGFLPKQLGRVFWDYHEKFQSNAFRRYQNDTEGTQHSAISNDDFIAKFGEKPWKIVNEIIRSFGNLDYEVVSPEGLPLSGSYQLKLRSRSDPSLLVDFESLSSGERVLLALVATVYKTSWDQRFPGLMLLDEIDASLHPSMTRILLRVIETVFLSRDAAVILVTHSPTTVALAPEDSAFIMRKQGVQPRISKESRGHALSILTDGFATLDEGLRLLDEVALKPVSVFTEGNNADYLSLFFELSGLTDVHVVRGLEGVSGKNQLRTIFDWISRVSLSNKALFVWDWDAQETLMSLQEQNNTFAFFLPKNEANSICKRGIENAFPEQLFESSVSKVIALAKTQAIREFHPHCKADFAQRIIGRRDISDFSGFASLADKVRAISEPSRNDG